MLPARTLTFEFEPVVTAPGVPPEEWEIVLVPLQSPLDGTIPDANLVGARRGQTFVMGHSVSFQVVPSDAPGVSTTVWYRVGWRPRFFGRLETFDFTMPDQDITFNQLKDLGAVIGDSIYLRQADVGVHVAGLDTEGYVLDGNGVRVGADNSQALAAVQQERLDRQTADGSMRTNLQDQITDVAAATLGTATARINAAVAVLESVDLAEAGSRVAAVAALNATIAGIQTDLNNQLATLAATVAQHTNALPTKADLVNGLLPTSQLPTLSLTTAVPVLSQAGMLALTSTQVQPGDLAVRPDGTWMLLQNPPATLDNWVKISTGGNVLSVNGQVGAVTLAAADVGAIAIGAAIDQSQITNLVASLAGKTDVATTISLDGRVTSIETDTAIVRSSAGIIAKSLMPSDVVFVDSGGVLRRKNGTVITTGGPGVSIDWTQVVNTPPSFPPTIGSTGSTAVAGNDTRLTNARTPIAHAATHVASGSDPITVTTGQVVGLTNTLNTYGSRINTLENAAPGGGTGGGGSPVKAVWYDGPDVPGITDPADFQAALVLQKSPFGQTTTDNTYYYNPLGADNDEWRWPMLTPNGHLKLIKWDETAPVDPPMATAASVTTVSNALALKADSSTVTTLSGTVATKADGSVVSALQTTVAGKADSSTVSALATTVAGKADASTVAAKADASTVTALTTTVSGKADAAATTAALALKANASDLAAKAAQTDLTALTTRVTTAEGTLTGKADASATTSALAAKADAAATTSALAGKADLVGGFIATSQIPPIALGTSVPVANRAALLALTSSQVQPGDLGVITGGVDKGTYMLMTTDPSQFTNWRLLVTTDAPVQSVNTQTGAVVLGPNDVNARSASIPVPLADVAGLSTALANKYDTSTATTALAGKTSPTDVVALIGQGSNKATVDLVATTAVASLSGVQSIDGTLTATGMRVLVTAQASSIANGIYLIPSPATGPWTRVADMPAGDVFAKGAYVTAGGTTGTNSQANTVWIQASPSGTVGTNANTWAKVLTAGPPLVYTSGSNDGLTITGTNIVVKTTTGIALTSAGVGADHTKVPFIYKTDVPGGSTSTTITHNLGTMDIASLTLMDKSSGTTQVFNLIGWTATGVNTVSLEFKTAPSAGQYRIVLLA